MKPYRSLAIPATLVIAVMLFVMATHVSSLADALVPTRLVRLVVQIGALTVTMVFVYRAACNLPSLGVAEPRYTPGQSVLWFFVPLLNLVMMHQVLTSLWRESQPGPSLAKRSRFDFSVPLVTIWWILSLLGMVVQRSGATPELMRLMQFILPIGLVAIVRGIWMRQREQWIDLERRRNVPQPSAEALR